MSHESKYTIDHQEIKRWVEAREGRPVSVGGTEHGKEKAGVLRIDFPGGASDPPLEPISWEDFFKKFDKEELAMVYQEEKADGSPSYFCKFVSKESAIAAQV